MEQPGARGNKARKTVYFFPVAGWLQSLFRRPDLCKYLSNKTSPSQYPSGHVRRSRGWHTKVTKNARMNKDERNQALIGSCDGVCTHSCTQKRISCTNRTPILHLSYRTPIVHMVHTYRAQHVHRSPCIRTKMQKTVGPLYSRMQTSPTDSPTVPVWLTL